MALENKIIVRFEPQGDKALITAINHLNVATKGLNASSKQYNDALKGLTNSQKSQIDSMLELNHSTRNLNNSFSTARSKMLLFSFAVGLVTNSALVFAKAWGVQEKAIIRLNQYVGGEVLGNLKKWASAQQSATQFGDELSIGEMRKVAALTNSEDAIKKATKLAMDYAATYDTDLSTAMDKVVQTMGTTRNAFKQTGLMTEQQNEALRGAGTALEKLDILYAALNPKVEGMSDTMGKTFSARMEQATNALGDMAEILGMGLVPIVLGAVAVIKIIAAIMDKLKFVIIPVTVALSALITAMGLYKLACLAYEGATWLVIKATAALKTTLGMVAASITAVIAVFAAIAYAMGFLGDVTKTTNSELEQHNMLINQNVKQLEGWLKNKKIFAAMQKSENKMLSESEKLGLKQAEIDLKRNTVAVSLKQATISKTEAERQNLALDIEQLKLNEQLFALDEKILKLSRQETELANNLNVINTRGSVLKNEENNLLNQFNDLINDRNKFKDDELKLAQNDIQQQQVLLAIGKNQEAQDQLAIENKHNLAMANQALTDSGTMTNELFKQEAMLKLELAKVTELHANAMEDEKAAAEATKIAVEAKINDNAKAIETAEKLVTHSVQTSKLAQTEAEKAWWKGSTATQEKSAQLALRKTQLQELEKEGLIDKWELEKAYAEWDAENADNQKDILQERLDAVQQLVNAYGGFLDSLEELASARDKKNKEDELADAKNIRNSRVREDKISDIEDKYAKKAEDRAKDMFALHVAEAISNTALSVTQVLSSKMPTWAKIPLALLMGATGAAQIAIMHQNTFEDGGLVGGRRHSEGGTMIEAEQGEFVVSRRGVDAIGVENLNRINQGGGAPVNVTFSGNVMSNDFIENEAIPQIKEAVRRGADIGVG